MFKQRIPRNSGIQQQSGFVLVWTAIGSLALITTGFIVWQLMVAHQLKLRAINDSVALSFQGSYSAQYPTSESLSAMTLLARAQGFSSAMPYNDAHQPFSNGEIQFFHDTRDAARHSVSAAVGHWKNPLTQLIASLGQIRVSAWAETRSEEAYYKLAIDNSASLMGDQSIMQSLAYFGVVDDPNGDTSCSNVGINGECDINNRVKPTPYIQTVMPFQFDGSFFRYARKWHYGPTGQELNSYYPPLWVWQIGAAGTCYNTAESFCPGWPINGSGAMGAWSSDSFLAFKNSAGVVLSVISMLSRLIDVDAFGGKMAPWIVDVANLIRGPSSILPLAVHEGVSPIWRFDEPTYTFPDPAVPGNAVIHTAHSVSNPKNIFTDEIQFYVTNLIQTQLTFKWSRIVASFADVLDDAFPPNVAVPAGTFGDLLMPIVPNLPIANWTDSFPWETSVAGNPVERFNSLQPLGVADIPEPILKTSGEGTPRFLPASVQDQWEYGWETPGGPMAQGCMLPNGSVFSQSSPGPFPIPQVPQRPVCLMPDGSIHPTDLPVCPCNGGNVYAAVLCHPDAPDFSAALMTPNTNGNNGVFCFPSRSVPGFYPRCEHGGVPTCVANPGPFTAATHRGTLQFPASPAVVKNNAFFAVKDMGLSAGGTWTNTLLRDSFYRLRDIRDQGINKQTLIIITDGVPSAVDHDGSYPCDTESPACYGPSCSVEDDCTMAESDAWIMDQVEHWTNSISALDVPIYVWYLTVPNLLTSFQTQQPLSSFSGFSAARQAELAATAFASPPAYIPSGTGHAQCPGPNSNQADYQWKYLCERINISLIPDYYAQTGKLDQFRTLMDKPQYKRYFIQSSLSIGASGSASPSTMFINGLLATAARILPRGELRR